MKFLYEKKTMQSHDGGYLAVSPLQINTAHSQ